MNESLARPATEDPSFCFSHDEESDQTVIEVIGELLVDITVDRLKRLAIKISTDTYIGTLTFVGLHSNQTKSDDMLWNPRFKSKERFGRMVLMHSNKREEIKSANAADTIATVGLKDTTTGDTWCAIDALTTLEKTEFPEPVIEVACEPASEQEPTR